MPRIVIVILIYHSQKPVDDIKMNANRQVQIINLTPPSSRATEVRYCTARTTVQAHEMAVFTIFNST
jgi:hypothetical protein